MLFASLVFLAVLALIATEWVHRTIVVMTGAAIFLLARVLDQHEAFAAIDLETLALLIGMMIIVAITERTGIFEHLALVAVRYAGGRPALIVATLTVMTAVLSAFLDNLTSILLVAPITIIIARKVGMQPVPLLIMQILASNIGGTATLIGDPPNIMIAGATGLSFNAFIVNLAPVAVFTLLVVTTGAYMVARRSFAIDGGLAPPIDDIQPDVVLAQGHQLWLPLGVLIATIVAFFVHGMLDLEPATIALIGASAILLTGVCSVEDALAGVDWTTLFFFAGLFVMVGGLEHAGVIDAIARTAQDATGGNRESELLGILGISAVGSAMVDNIPFTAAMIPVVEQLNDGDDNTYWWALALGACFGGNATIIAAAANVAAQGVAARHGIELRFLTFLAWGLPTTIASIAIAAAYLMLFYR